MRSRSMIVPALLAAALLGACEGQERYYYKSEPHSPKTITLIDTTNQDVLLAVEVPVGHQLNMQFDSTRKRTEERGYDTLRWAVRPWGDKSLGKANIQQVPPASARRIDMTIRAQPEARPEAK
ncbi:MAG TPA: hypothetical protein VD971_09435 [Phycisphaerales bacterium]|nr:hypothetical protein [Phycisphaerales bacterium]